MKPEDASRLLCAVLGAVSFLPGPPIMPSADLDVSWGLVLQHAMRRGWQFGPTITFTYGPLGYLAVPVFAPDIFWWTVVCRAVIGAVCGMAFFHVCRNSGCRPWLPAAAMAVLWPPATAAFDVPWLLPTMLWPFVVLADRRRPIGLMAAVLSAAVGFTALVKFTTLVLASMLALLFGVNDVLRHRRWPVTLLLYVVTLVLAWALSGQVIGNMPSWLASSWQTAAGYGEAMGTPVGPYQLRELFVFGVNAVALLGIGMWSATTYADDRWHAALQWAAIALIVFVQFKLGFVRHDAHAVAAMFAMPLLGALTIVSGCRAPLNRTWRLAAVVLIGLGFVTYAYGLRRHFDRLSPLEHYRGYYASRVGAVALVRHPSTAHRRLTDAYQAALENLRATFPLPSLAGTVDLYGHRQGALLAYPSAYAPGPVFQSYGLYTADLTALNREYLRGERGPHHVLVDVETIDHRYPLTDEAGLLLTMWSTYEAVGTFGPFAHLERRSDGRPPVEWQRTSARSVHLDETMSIDEHGSPIWGQIDVDLSWPGRLAALAYKVSPVVVDVGTGDGRWREHRVIRSIAQAGMLLSPLVTSADEFVSLARGETAAPERRVRALRIRTGWRWAYQQTVGVTLFRLQAAPIHARVAGHEGQPIGVRAFTE